GRRRLPPPPHPPYTTLFRSRGMPASGENGDTAGPGIDDDVAAIGTCASGSFINASVSDLNEVPVVGLRLVGVEDDVPALGGDARSEEHTSELQSRENLVCRL